MTGSGPLAIRVLVAERVSVSSPSMEGDVVYRRAATGREAWRDFKGVSLKGYQHAEASE